MQTSIMVHLSNIIIPALIFYVIMTGLTQKKDIYRSFTKGAQDGVQTVMDILPTLLGLMVSVGFLGEFCGRFLENFPQELMSLFLVKIFSSSAATGILLDIYKEYGTDSYAGLVASITVSSTETVFYTMSVYFMTIKVTKTRWTLSGALLATIAGILVSILIAGRIC